MTVISSGIVRRGDRVTGFDWDRPHCTDCGFIAISQTHARAHERDTGHRVSVPAPSGNNDLLTSSTRKHTP